MSDSVRPHRQQPTRLPHPWDSPGKNTGVGCHFLLQCVKAKSESEVAQLCPTLSDPMDCSPPGSSVHGISRQEYWSRVPLPSLIKHTDFSFRNLGSCLVLVQDGEGFVLYCFQTLEKIWKRGGLRPHLPATQRLELALNASLGYRLQQ